MALKQPQPLVSASNTLLARLSTFVLVGLLGLTCAQIFWQAYSYWRIPSQSIQITLLPLNGKSPTENQSNYADDIGSAYLFGRPLTPKIVVKLATAELPESSLKVTIKGILALRDAARSTVILSIENAQDKVFKVGQELKAGYSVDQIVAQGVVLDHNGRLEMIRLPRATLSEISVNNSSEYSLSAVGLGQLRAEVLRNPLAMEQHINFVPHNQDGQFAGYRVNPGSKPQLFIKLGLQANDIVASVDGVGIGELAGRMDILTNLSIAKSLRLGIIRNGQEQQLLLDFSQ